MDEQTAVTLARIEGKLDLINAALTAVNTRGDDHEARLRVLEARPVIDPERVAALETRPTVSPKALAAAVTTVAAVVSALTPFLAQLYS